MFARIHPDVCVKGVPGKAIEILGDQQMRTEIAHSHVFDYILLLDADSTWKPSNALTVVFASPDVRNTAGFSSNRVHSIILMPPWEKEELWHCLRKAYEKSDRDAFDKCFERWGGSIDFHRNSDVAERKLWEFLQSDELFCFVEEVGNSSLSRMIDTHKMTTNFQAFYFQYPPKEDQYRLTKGRPLVEFPSKQLLFEAVNEYHTRKPKGGFGVQGTTLGRVYEQFLFKHVLVPNASPVTIEANNDREELRISTIEFFNNKSTNLYQSAGVLYRPVEPNKKGIDCVFEDKLIQITTSATHQKLIQVM